MLWGIYSAIYGEVNVSVEKCVEIKGDYVEKQQSSFISVTLKSGSGQKLLDHPTTYVLKDERKVLVLWGRARFTHVAHWMFRLHGKRFGDKGSYDTRSASCKGEDGLSLPQVRRLQMWRRYI